MGALAAFCAGVTITIAHGIASKPNIIWFITDDQDAVLGSYEVMPNLQKYMIGGGRTFARSYVASPKCCPSRTSALSGRYPHGLDDQNLGWCGNFSQGENTTFAVDLQAAGYTTGLVGKYSNGFSAFCGDNIHCPLGYTDFFAMCDESRYFNLTYNDNGVTVVGGDAPEDYLTAVLGNRTLAFLSNATAQGPSSPPFYAYIGMHAPHLPAEPAPWHVNATVPTQAPRTPNWNTGMVGKHYQVSSHEPMNEWFQESSDFLFSDRLRTLIAVDDVLGQMFNLLEERGVLNNTYVIYTSDHGYHLGQWSLFAEKAQPYEETSRIPYFVRGPGIVPNSTSEALVSSIDVGATVLELAGVTGPGQRMTDGRSIVPVLTGTSWPRDRLLIEYFGWNAYQFMGACNGTVFGMPCPPPADAGSLSLLDSTSNTFAALRIVNATSNILYAEYRPGGTDNVPGSTNWTEAYDLTQDPWQLTNLADPASPTTLPPSALAQLSRELWAVANCETTSCP